MDRVHGATVGQSGDRRSRPAGPPRGTARRVDRRGGRGGNAPDAGEREDREGAAGLAGRGRAGERVGAGGGKAGQRTEEAVEGPDGLAPSGYQANFQKA